MIEWLKNYVVYQLLATTFALIIGGLVFTRLSLKRRCRHNASREVPTRR